MFKEHSGQYSSSSAYGTLAQTEVGVHWGGLAPKACHGLSSTNHGRAIVPKPLLSRLLDCKCLEWSSAFHAFGCITCAIQTSYRKMGTVRRTFTESRLSEPINFQQRAACITPDHTQYPPSRGGLHVWNSFLVVCMPVAGYILLTFQRQYSNWQQKKLHPTLWRGGGMNKKRKKKWRLNVVASGNT